jgi:hypothetical protein
VNKDKLRGVCSLENKASEFKSVVKMDTIYGYDFAPKKGKSYPRNSKNPVNYEVF